MNLQPQYLIVDMAQEVFCYDNELNLESGEILPRFQISYTTQGQLTPTKDNVIWVIHALNGEANVSVLRSDLVGDTTSYDLTNIFIVSSNHLYSSTYSSTT